MPVAALGQVRQDAVAAAQDLLVGSPALECRAGEAVDGELEVGVAEDGRIEADAVGGARPRAERSMGIQRLCAAEQVAQLSVDVRIGFSGTGFGARLDGVLAAFLGREVDVDICRGGRGVGGVGAVDVDGDGGLEDALAVLDKGSLHMPCCAYAPKRFSLSAAVPTSFSASSRV